MVAGEIAQPTELLVLGGGPGGYTAAARAAELGKQVVLVESSQLGGTCLNVGCIPSKAIITLAHDFSRTVHRMNTSTGFTGSVDIDLEAAMRWKDGIVDGLRAGVSSMLGKVEVVQGTGRFIGPDRVAVENDDGVVHFRFEHAIIATGSRPIEISTLPFDGVRVVDSTGALLFDVVPERLVVVGGGYIGIELGTAYAMLGSAVTVVEAADRLMTGFDSDVVELVRQRLDECGVQVMTEAQAVGHDGTAVLVEHGGATVEVPADRVIVAVGRRPNTDDLQLEDVGLSVGPGGLIQVDDARRTASPRVYAIGDVVEGPALAHKAVAEGRVAAEAICGGVVGFDQLVPRIAFCSPELAAVGLGEDEARAAGVDVTVGMARFDSNGRAVTLSESSGLVKVIGDSQSGVVLGVQIAGPSASELIAEAALAVESGLRVADIALTVHSHPTLSEAVQAAARVAQRRFERSRRRE